MKNKNAHRSERVCTQALVGICAAGGYFTGVEPNLLADHAKQATTPLRTESIA